jgi:hypothetical protein
MYRFFINRPIVAMVIAILMVIIGAVSMVSLPVSQFPNIVPPEIRIQTTFLGGDAQTLAQSVATPIEEQMSGVDNMNYMYSISANNGVMRRRVPSPPRRARNFSRSWILLCWPAKVKTWPTTSHRPPARAARFSPVMPRLRGKLIYGAASAGSTNPPASSFSRARKWGGT